MPADHDPIWDARGGKSVASISETASIVEGLDDNIVPSASALVLPASLRCKIAVASVSWSMFVQRLAAGMPRGNVIFMVVAFCAEDPVAGVLIRNRNRLPSSTSAWMEWLRGGRQDRRGGSVSSVGQHGLDFRAGMQRTEH